MSGRPVRHRLLSDIEDAGGWPAVLERIESGETISAIARSFNVSRGFFARVLHEDADRHEVVLRLRGMTPNPASLLRRKRRLTTDFGQLHLAALRKRARQQELARSLARAASPAEPDQTEESTPDDGAGDGSAL